jgi:hypothetical protein
VRPCARKTASWAAHDGEPRPGQVRGQPPGHGQPVRPRVARPDNSNTEAIVFLELSAHIQERRRVGNLPQKSGITGLVPESDGDTQFLEPLQGAVHVLNLAARRNNPGANLLRDVPQRCEVRVRGGQNPGVVPELLEQAVPGFRGEFRARQREGREQLLGVLFTVHCV